jgi:hypothetical protein
MRRYAKDKTLLQPIWKIFLKDGLSFYVLGKDRNSALCKVLKEPSIMSQDIDKIIGVTRDEAKNILLDLDGDMESFDTLFEEAIWIQESKEDILFVATCFDVIVDYNVSK